MEKNKTRENDNSKNQFLLKLKENELKKNLEYENDDVLQIHYKKNNKYFNKEDKNKIRETEKEREIIKIESNNNNLINIKNFKSK